MVAQFRGEIRHGDCAIKADMTSLTDWPKHSDYLIFSEGRTRPPVWEPGT
jgi:hypothetical protein